jgi:hypothetical protein
LVDGATIFGPFVGYLPAVGILLPLTIAAYVLLSALVSELLLPGH